jgi:uncharacterized protein with HEPN domain
MKRTQCFASGADAVSGFVTGRSRGVLDADRMVLFALVRAVEVFGEAAAKVSASTKAASLEISWQQIVAMRNSIDTRLFRH